MQHAEAKRAMHAAMLPAPAAVDRLRWQWLTPSPDSLYQTPAALGWSVLTPMGLVIRVAADAITGMIIVSILALFEEASSRNLNRLACRF